MYVKTYYWYTVLIGLLSTSLLLHTQALRIIPIALNPADFTWYVLLRQEIKSNWHWFMGPLPVDQSPATLLKQQVSKLEINQADIKAEFEDKKGETTTVIIEVPYTTQIKSVQPGVELSWYPVSLLLIPGTRQISRKDGPSYEVSPDLRNFLIPSWSTQIIPTLTSQENIPNDQFSWFMIPNAIYFSDLQGTRALKDLYGALSNNAEGYPIKIDNKTWRTVEEYYNDQLTQSKDKNDKRKLEIMEKAIRAKFTQNSKKLTPVWRATENHILVYLNEEDAFFGTGRDGKGSNHLGQLLMQIRSELRGEIDPATPYASRQPSVYREGEYIPVPPVVPIIPLDQALLNLTTQLASLRASIAG